MSNNFIPTFILPNSNKITKDWNHFIYIFRSPPIKQRERINITDCFNGSDHFFVTVSSFQYISVVCFCN